jgi:hypothetical protein
MSLIERLSFWASSARFLAMASFLALTVAPPRWG